MTHDAGKPQSSVHKDTGPLTVQRRETTHEVRCTTCGRTYLVGDTNPPHLQEMLISGTCPACWAMTITLPELAEEFQTEDEEGNFVLTDQGLADVISAYIRRVRRQ